MAQSDQRIKELDGIRGVAVLMVLVWHFVGCMTVPANGGLDFALYATTIFGRTGVDLFFVLSGFLIIGILVDNREAANFFRAFYIRRIARIFPAYFLLIVVYWVCVVAIGPSPAFNASYGLAIHLGAQVTFLYNWLMAIANGAVSSGFSVTWSIAIEEQFYLIAPLCIWLTPRKHLIKLLLGGAALAIGLRAAFYAIGPKYSLAPYILPFTRMDCLCAGGLLALAWRTPAAFAIIKKIAPATLAILSMLVVLLVFCITTGNTSAHMYYWGHTTLSAFYFFVLLLVLVCPPRQLRNPILTSVGSISYGLYLFHPLFISLIFQVADRPERVSRFSDALLAFGALISSIIFCIVIYFVLERPIRRLGHKISYESPSQLHHQSLGTNAPA
ncbi:acyltransferase family protein [Nitrobacteraceae bacterium UC4446_H13]